MGKCKKINQEFSPTLWHFMVRRATKGSHSFTESIRELQAEENKYPGQYIDGVNGLKKQLHDIQSSNIKGVKLRSRAKLLDNGERPTRYFFKGGFYRSKNKCLNRLRTASGIVFTQEGIMSACRDFYINLSCDPIDRTVRDEFLVSLPRLDPTTAQLCDGPITKNEIYTALCGLKNKRTPGNDGLTKGFYLSPFTDILVSVYNKCYLEATASVIETRVLLFDL